MVELPDDERTDQLAHEMQQHIQGYKEVFPHEKLNIEKVIRTVFHWQLRCILFLDVGYRLHHNPSLRHVDRRLHCADHRFYHHEAHPRALAQRVALVAGVLPAWRHFCRVVPPARICFGHVLFLRQQSRNLPNEGDKRPYL